MIQVSEGFHLINIASDEHMANIVLSGEFTKTGYGAKARLLKKPHRRVIDKSEDLAYLPVGRM